MGAMMGEPEHKTAGLRIKLTPSLLDELRRHANQKDLPMGYVVRQAVKEYLEREQEANDGGP